MVAKLLCFSETDITQITDIFLQNTTLAQIRYFNQCSLSQALTGSSKSLRLAHATRMLTPKVLMLMRSVFACNMAATAQIYDDGEDEENRYHLIDAII